MGRSTDGDTDGLHGWHRRRFVGGHHRLTELDKGLKISSTWAKEMGCLAWSTRWIDGAGGAWDVVAMVAEEA